MTNLLSHLSANRRKEWKIWQRISKGKVGKSISPSMHVPVAMHSSRQTIEMEIERFATCHRDMRKHTFCPPPPKTRRKILDLITTHICTVTSAALVQNLSAHKPLSWCCQPVHINLDEFHSVSLYLCSTDDESTADLKHICCWNQVSQKECKW
jgi:hypothetical protein